MRLSISPRTLLRRLFVSGIAAAAMVSIVVAAVPGFPFTEDFTDTSLRDASLDTATWDTAAPGTLRLGTAASLTGLSGTQSDLGGGLDSPHESRGIALGDFDGDGDLDAAVANRNEANLIYFNNAGAFDTAPVALGGRAGDSLSIAAGDLDLDGDLDLVVGNAGSGNSRRNLYYLNNGAGQFADGVDVAEDANKTWPIILVDVDGDGDLDLIDGFDGNRNELFINRYAETGSFSFSTGVQIGNQNLDTRSMAVGDINGDGFVDLVTGEFDASNIAFLGDGAGGFDGGTVIQGSEVYSTFAVALADLDGDGDLDLIEGNQQDLTNLVNGETRVYENDGAGNFSASTVIPGSDSAHTTTALLALDFDRDGDIDIFEGNNNGQALVPNRLFLNNGGANPTIVDMTATFFERTYGVAAGDLDGDGILDIVAANQEATSSPTPSLNTAYRFTSTGTGSATTQLQSQAVSLEVDGADDNIRFARVTMDSSVPVSADLDFFLSNDDGTTWKPITPNGRPIRFASDDNNLRWRAELSSASPNSGQLPTVSNFTIAGGNANPDFRGPATISAAEGETISVQMDFRDGDGDLLTYQINDGLPSGTGLSIDNLTGILSGTLTPEDAAASPITIRAFAFDGASTGSSASDGDIVLTVGAADTTPPVITLVGPASVVVAVGATYTDQGATATDNIDGDITGDIVTTNPVDTSIIGDYIVRYNVSDSSGNAATEVMRTVSVTDVVDTTPPVITLIGSAAVSLTVGSSYTDAGATATDDTDGDITANIVTDNPVNTASAGTYIVTYNVSDAAGNAAVEVRRTVTVSNPTPPPSGGGGGGGATGLFEFATLALFGMIALAGRRRGRRSGQVI